MNQQNILININMDYEEALSLLKLKYGDVPYPYFKKELYDTYINHVSKSLSSERKNSRTDEGLTIHHIYENQIPLLSSPDFLREYNIPYLVQEKEGLIYVNEIEHYILHIIIGRKTHGKLGYGGAAAYIAPKLEQWFDKKILPKKNWEMNCYNAVLNSDYNVLDILDQGYYFMDCDDKKNMIK